MKIFVLINKKEESIEKGIIRIYANKKRAEEDFVLLSNNPDDFVLLEYVLFTSKKIKKTIVD